MTDISFSAFDRCGKLSITVDSSNENFCAENGTLYDKNKTELILCRGEQSGSFTVPDSVKNIGNKAFLACGNLTEIIIPSGVTRIGSLAFEGCDSLVNIEIPDTVKTIGGGAFRECKKLETIKLPKVMDNIGDYAFENCESLTSVELPGGMARVQPFLFYHCKKLKDVKISSGTIDICNASFTGCSSIVSLTIPSSLRSVWANVFLDDATLSDIYYEGTQQQWDGIAKNADFKKIADRATIHFECRDKFAETQAEQKTNEKTCISLRIGDSELTVNGQSVTMDVSPVIADNTTMLPIRMVAEALGATVEWGSAAQTVIIHDNNTNISIPLLSSVATVNNTKSVDIGVKTFIRNGRTYVPVRFVSEALGADVDWNGETKTVTITKR